MLYSVCRMSVAVALKIASDCADHLALAFNDVYETQRGRREKNSFDACALKCSLDACVCVLPSSCFLLDYSDSYIVHNSLRPLLSLQSTVYTTIFSYSLRPTEYVAFFLHAAAVPAPE